MDADRRRGGDVVRRDTDIPERLAREMDRDDLSRMIRETQESEGLSLQDMADRSSAAGHPVSKPYFQKLSVNAISKAPKPEQLEGIAAALRRPLRVVQAAAAAQWLAYEATELGGFSDDVRVVVAHLSGMDEEGQRRWRAMIEADEQARRHR